MTGIAVAALPLRVIRNCLKVDPPEKWLSAAETIRLSEIVDSGSKLRFLAGRWIVKELLRNYGSVSPRDRSRWHVESRDPRNLGVSPRIFFAGRLTGYGVTLSHGESVVSAAIAIGSRDLLGIDVIAIRPVSASLVDYWYSSAEKKLYRESLMEASVVWSLKEACFKGCGYRSRFVPSDWDTTRWISPRRIREVASWLASNASGPLSHTTHRHGFHWLVAGQDLVTLVTDPAAGPISWTTSAGDRHLAA